jgi:hypothetical protein
VLSAIVERGWFANTIIRSRARSIFLPQGACYDVAGGRSVSSNWKFEEISGVHLWAPDLSDGGGLQLWITPQGAKYWRLAYRFTGKQRLHVLGTYPAVTLKQARTARDNIKDQLSQGVDPSQKKKLGRIAAQMAASNTFQTMVDQLLAKKLREGEAESTMGKLEWILGLATPDLGPLFKILKPELELIGIHFFGSFAKLQTPHLVDDVLQSQRSAAARSSTTSSGRRPTRGREYGSELPR